MKNNDATLNKVNSEEIKNNIKDNSNLEYSLIFFVLYFISLFFLYNAWVNAVGLISDKFASLMEMTPIVLSYLLPVIYLIVLFRQLYFKKFSKGGLIAFLITTSILVIGALVLFFFKYDYHINNFLSHYKNYFSPFDNLFILIGLLLVNLVLFVKALAHKFEFKYRDPVCPGVFNVYSGGRMFVIGFYLIFTGYSFINGFKGALITNNFVNFPLGYTLLILTSVLPMVTFIFYLFLNPQKKSTFVLYTISLALFVLSLAGLLVMQYLVSDFITSKFDQNLFRITYAGSLVAQYMLFGLILVFNLVSFIVNAIKVKNANN